MHATRGLRHIPALDGLRGLAVLGVIAYHAGHLTGGYLGVDLFFVLSGFLITSLLVAEHTAKGRIDLRMFWTRRARRLLPALFLTLLGVALYAAVLAQPGELPQIRVDSLATLVYVANWNAVVSNHSYWVSYAVPSPLQHTWSLAIEEQFYVVWPLVTVFVIKLGRRQAGMARRDGANAAAAEPAKRTLQPAVLLLILSVAGAIASAGFMIFSYKPDDDGPRLYFGTDTVDGLNAIYEREVAATPNASMIDLAGYVCPNRVCRLEKDGVTIRSDGLHFSETSAVWVGTWVLQQVFATETPTH